MARDTGITAAIFVEMVEEGILCPTQAMTGSSVFECGATRTSLRPSHGHVCAIFCIPGIANLVGHVSQGALVVALSPTTRTP